MELDRLLMSERCNEEKSDLEDEISAASLYPWPGNPQSDANVREGLRKAAGSFSRQTGKLIKDSEQRREISAFLPSNATLKFGVVAPPQVSDGRICRLAGMHMLAVFYMLTYSIQNRVGRRWPGGFGFSLWARRTDWGNTKFRAFMPLVRNWQLRAVIHSASDHFKIMVRKHPEHDCWAWGMEWNKNFRCVGFFGDIQYVQSSFELLPEPVSNVFSREAGRTVTIRGDVPLADADDTLFVI